MAGLLTLVAALIPLAVEAHRPGESYAYIQVGDGPLSGEVHVRATDIARIEAYGARPDAHAPYQGFAGADLKQLLRDRLQFFSGGETFRPVFSGETDFGTGKDQFLVLPFEVPGLPSGDGLDASFTFMFDGPNPRHRTYLLMASNDRLGLRENEAKPSLVFGPGAERQAVRFDRRPATTVIIESVGHGLRQVLMSLPHLALLGAALVGLSLGQRQSLGGAAQGAFTLAAGLAVGAGAFLYSGAIAGPKQTLAAFAAAALAIAIAMWPHLGAGLRHLAAFAGAGLLGSVSAHFADRVGIEAGLLGQVLPGFAIGAFGALLAIGLLVNGLSGLIADQRGPSPGWSATAAALLLAIGTGLGWAATRSMV